MRSSQLTVLCSRHHPSDSYHNYCLCTTASRFSLRRCWAPMEPWCTEAWTWAMVVKSPWVLTCQWYFRHSMLTIIFKMLLNWNTINSCFLSSAFRVRSSAGFFAVCICSFLLVFFLEFLRRLQRKFDNQLRCRHHQSLNNRDTKELNNLSDTEPLVERTVIRERVAKGRSLVVDWHVVIEQVARGLVHTMQFGISYCVMLLVMYSNGESLCSPTYGISEYWSTAVRLRYYLDSARSLGGICFVLEGYNWEVVAQQVPGLSQEKEK